MYLKYLSKLMPNSYFYVGEVHDTQDQVPMAVERARLMCFLIIYRRLMMLWQVMIYT